MVACPQLAKIAVHTKQEVLLPENRFAPLITQAARTIADCARNNPKLTDKQLDQIITVYRIFAPKDPAGTLFKLTAPMIIANREAIDSRVAALSREESQFLAEKMDKATMDLKAPGNEGPKATPPPAGTPTL